MLRKKIEFYVIDGYKVAREAGMGSRINTIMQTCFFAISGVLPREEAIEQIKKAIKKTYGKRGEAVVKQIFRSFWIRAGNSCFTNRTGAGDLSSRRRCLRLNAGLVLAAYRPASLLGFHHP